MKKVLFLLILLGLTLSVFAQTRKDINIYIPNVLAPPAQAQFFKESFDMETTAAGYSLADNSKDADYTLKLAVKPNMILYDDGTEEPAGPDEKQFILQINLTRNEDNIELVAFSFPFTDVSEMYEFNLFLLYEAMANVPLTKMHDNEEDTRWRNKWLYVRASFDYPITFYKVDGESVPGYALKTKDPNPDTGKPDTFPINNVIAPYPAATVGLELQYLNWMSTEVNFNLSFKDPMGSSFIPAIQVEQKFPIKLEKHFMIEPYGAVSFPTNTSPDVRFFPFWGIGGGLQLGMKGGNTGALFVDVNYLYFVDDVTMKNTNDDFPKPGEIKYKRSVLGLGIGYKIGVGDRPGAHKSGKHKPVKAKPAKAKPGKSK